MRAFYCDHFVLPLPDGHRFPMDKYRRLRERILAEGLVAPGDLREPEAASWAMLARIHTAEYLEAVADGTLTREGQRRIGFPWSPAMVERARRSVGGTLAAIAAAWHDGVAVNLAGGTHHAFADGGNGYCVFNDIAVAAAALLDRASTGWPSADRILVVDLDVHQGDGTAHIFRHEPRVFTFSIHGEKNYPFRKQASDLDVPLPAGTGDAEYLTALETHLPAILDHHDPDAVFYLAGADPFEGDRLGHLKLTVDGLRARDRLVFERCRSRGLPVAVSMGGGYAPDIDAIVTIHVNTIREAVRASRPQSMIGT